jgi:EAL domain-containing protein (putative c-di-GMP-specific phosphodiesterase class I)
MNKTVLNRASPYNRIWSTRWNDMNFDSNTSPSFARPMGGLSASKRCCGGITLIEVSYHPRSDPSRRTVGDIIEIGRWVLEHACVDRHRWDNENGRRSIRDGRQHLSASAHGFRILGHGETTFFPSRRPTPKNLCLEITETSFVQDAERALTVLSQLKELGIQLALDDFGTGYSSLSYLMEFPVDVVKIDQSFIAKLTNSKASHAIVSKTIELAHLLDLTVVCEGVETAEQDREVAALTSDFSQGFYLSRPMKAEMLDEMTSVVGLFIVGPPAATSDV